MLRKALLSLYALVLIPCILYAETIDVNIKGIDDGVKTTKQQDYKEAVLFAKREAIERAGVKVKSLTTAKDFIVQSDYIESKAEAVLLPGYNIIDVGYQQDGIYVVILIGKVKTSFSDSISKEIGPDVRFITNANGVVLDKKTGLEWYGGSDRDTNWYEAKSWAESLSINGGGWRMPTRAELKGLYNPGMDGTVMIDPAFMLNACCVWSGENKDSLSAYYFFFGRGGASWHARGRDSSWNKRAFAVRSRK